MILHWFLYRISLDGGRLKVEQSGGLCSSVKRYQKPELMKMRKGAVKEITETEYLDFKADQTEGRG